VDVYGLPQCGVEWHGVQCKGKNKFLNQVLTSNEIDTEVKNAKSFKPRIEHFTIATTAARDATLQAYARKIKEPFRLSIWSWDDISEELNLRTVLRNQIYFDMDLPDWSSTEQEGTITAIHHRSEPVDRLNALLSAPHIVSILSAALRIDLRNVLIELALNAYEHGEASHLEIVLHNKTIEVRDDGIEFNPLNAAREPVRSGGTGIYYLGLFLKKYKEIVKSTYARSSTGDNVLSFTFPKRLEQQQTAVTCQIIVSDLEAYSPDKARHLAKTAEVPTGCDVYYFHASSIGFSASSFFNFLEVLLPRIPQGSRLKLSFDDGSDLGECIDHWREWRKDMRWDIIEIV